MPTQKPRRALLTCGTGTRTTAAELAPNQAIPPWARALLVAPARPTGLVPFAESRRHRPGTSNPPVSWDRPATPAPRAPRALVPFVSPGDSSASPVAGATAETDFRMTTAPAPLLTTLPRRRPRRRAPAERTTVVPLEGDLERHDGGALGRSAALGAAPGQGGEEGSGSCCDSGVRLCGSRCGPGSRPTSTGPASAGRNDNRPSTAHWDPITRASRRLVITHNSTTLWIPAPRTLPAHMTAGQQLSLIHI